MATANPFDLLRDDETDDPSQLIEAAAAQAAASAAVGKKTPAAATAGQAVGGKQAKFPSKPAPPAQSVRESRSEAGRGGGRGGGRDRGRGGYARDSINNENGYYSGPKPFDDDERRGGYGGSRGNFRGGRRGDLTNGEVVEGDRPRRAFDRHSGNGRSNEDKREGSGRGNWGNPTDGVVGETEVLLNETEKNLEAEKNFDEDDAVEANKEKPVSEPQVKEPEIKLLTLEEYEKVVEEKRKALLADKPEERKVNADEEFQSMQQLSNKKSNDEIFVKLGSEKDKRKDTASEKEEKAKKAVSINEFLKPAEGERFRYQNPRRDGGGRGSRGGGYNRGYNQNEPDRGRGPRADGGGYNRGNNQNETPPVTETKAPGYKPPSGKEFTKQFPTLGGKT